MIGLDTNVLVRYIMQGDPKQSPKARALIASLDTDNPGFVTLVSVLVLYWVLTSCYGLTGSQVKQALEALLRPKQIIAHQSDQVLRALRVLMKVRQILLTTLLSALHLLQGVPKP